MRDGVRSAVPWTLLFGAVPIARPSSSRRTTWSVSVMIVLHFASLASNRLTPCYKRSGGRCPHVPALVAADAARPRRHGGAAGHPRLQRRDGSHARRHEGRHGDECHRPRGAADADHARAARRVGEPARRRPAPADLDRVDHEAARPALGVRDTSSDARTRATGAHASSCSPTSRGRRSSATSASGCRGCAGVADALHATTSSPLSIDAASSAGRIDGPHGCVRGPARGTPRGTRPDKKKAPPEGTPSSFCCGDRI